MKFVVTTAPAAEPVSLADVKLYLRTICDDTTEDDAILSPLITAAREFCENATGRSMAAQTIKVYLDSFESVRLPRPPFISVTSIRYRKEDGSYESLTDYDVDEVDGIIYFDNPPTDKLYKRNPVEVTYTAGYSTLPTPLRQAMLMLIGHWYTNRDAVQIGSRINEVAADFAFQNLIHHYKVWWF